MTAGNQTRLLSGLWTIYINYIQYITYTLVDNCHYGASRVTWRCGAWERPPYTTITMIWAFCFWFRFSSHRCVFKFDFVIRYWLQPDYIIIIITTTWETVEYYAMLISAYSSRFSHRLELQQRSKQSLCNWTTITQSLHIKPAVPNGEKLVVWLH